MKIYISIYDSIKNPFYCGGGARAIHEIAKRLAQNHWVTVIAGAYKNCGDEVIDGIVYKYIGIKSAGPRLGQIIFSLLLPYYVVQEYFDVWIESFLPPHSTGFLPLFTKKPVIGLTMILHADKFGQKYWLPFHLVEKLGLKKYKYFIVLNKKLYEKVKNVNPNAYTKIIPVAVDKDLKKVKIKEGKYVLYLGRLDIFNKGLDYLLDIWAKLNKFDKSVKLKIAGNGVSDQMKKLKQMISLYKLEDNITLCGKVEDREKKKLLANCLIGVSTSRFESFGIVALEFMTCGKPFVCFDIDGFSWIPKGISKKVLPYSTGNFAAEIKKLIDNAFKRKQLGKKARRFARAFSYEETTKQYEEYLKNVQNTYAN